ncbi:lysophospholipase [Methylocaldum sp.]|uniref:alpha/beta hydrolase n=1 Tax=Methylocaldum sp. TaxID=1969727 RepID=UPI002D2F1BCE|nr:lysophospholipase [Methylocaldum sp.]HYE34665.1 alpha/beta hydrolase [Methylocaldum sp.]
MKKHSRSQWLSLMQETEYALDHSGSMIFLGALLIGSHLLHSPAYARIVFALVLLLCLMPKVVCSFCRMKEQPSSKRPPWFRSMIVGPLRPWHFNSGRLALALKAGLRRARTMAVMIAVTGITLLFGALLLSTTYALLDQNPEPKATTTPRLIGNYFITGDHARLPTRSWVPEHRPVKAVIVALHGFNDYSAFFEEPGNYLTHYGIGSYAYDQRGFGGAPKRGSWAGIPIYLHDLSEFVRLIQDRHPGIPIYLLGESMGAAEIMVALTHRHAPPADGIILSAPAVWGWKTVPWYQRAALWTAAHTVPWLRLTGESLHLVPSDNTEMLRALYHDPLVLKETRIGTVYGVADLMSRASEQVDKMDRLTLVLYGERDEIIPKASVYRMLKRAPRNGRWRIAFYEKGYHLLLRDLEAPRLWQDIAAWIENPAQDLPSGADRRAFAVLSGGRS